MAMAEKAATTVTALVMTAGLGACADSAGTGDGGAEVEQQSEQGQQDGAGSGY